MWRLHSSHPVDLSSKLIIFRLFYWLCLISLLRACHDSDLSSAKKVNRIFWKKWIEINWAQGNLVMDMNSFQSLMSPTVWWLSIWSVRIAAGHLWQDFSRTTCLKNSKYVCNLLFVLSHFIIITREWLRWGAGELHL